MRRSLAALLLAAAPLAADVFQARLERGTLPQKADPPWTEDGRATIETADGALKVTTTVDDSYMISRDWLAKPGQGVYVRLRLRMFSYKGNRAVGGAALRIADGAHELILLFTTDAIQAFGTQLAHRVDLTDRLHDLRVGASATDFEVELDGVRVIDGKGRFTQRAQGRSNAVQFGDASQVAGATWSMELIAYAVGRSRNLAPAFTPATDLAVPAREGEPVGVEVGAKDPDGDALRYTARGLPEGASLEETTGRLSWTPSFKSAGKHAIDVAASDGDWSSERRVEVEVADVNRPPVFSQPKKQEGAFDAGTLISFSIGAEDPDEDALRYRVEGLPNGAAFDPATRMLRWTPMRDQVGKHTVCLFASDGRVEVERAFTFRIEARR